MAKADSKAYWDQRARENALYFVDSGLNYSSPDEEAFWRGGDEVIDQLLGSTGCPLESDDDVLDIGCGVGRLTRALAARVGSVTGIDISEEMLSRATTRNADVGNVHWVLGDGESLRPLDDASFDLCVSHVVFQHIPDPSVTLGYVLEIGRVLRPGGRALFVLSTDPAIHRQRPSLKMRAKALVGKAPRGGDNPAWLGSAVDEGRLREALEEAGLALEKLIRPGSQFTTVYAVRR